MEYQALYRQFRPAVFEDMVGQEHIVTALVNQIKTGKTAHAYLFCGTRGTGKTTTARIFSRAVNCESPIGADPCNNCETCLSINNGSSVDVIEIDAASNTGVDNIRQIREEVAYPPVLAKYKVDICGINTNDLKVLKNDEMILLFKKYKNGDTKAKEDLVYGNLKLVLSILRKYNNRTDKMDDLFQIGCIGLIKAIDNFDLSHEVKFSTYACPMIIGEIKKYLRDNNSVRISRSIKENAYKIVKEKELIATKENREATHSELCKNLNLTDYELFLATNSLKEIMSMSEPIYNDGGDVIYLKDQLEDKKDIYSKEDYISLKEALKEIKEKERYIINSRYIYGKTQMELSEELGISQAQISRLEKSGIDKIKKLIL